MAEIPQFLLESKFVIKAWELCIKNWCYSGTIVMNWDLQAYGYSQTRIIENLRVFVVYAVLHSFITMLYELSLTQQKFCNPQACVKVIFNFVDVFPSTFLQPVNWSKNSIYTELSYETWSLHVFETIEIFSILFSYSLSDYLLLQSSVRNALWRPKLKKITTEIVNYAISKQ